VVFAGEEYGTGSSRDWAAKGTQLLGIKAVVAKSFERIHRSNLVGMGVLPCSSRPVTMGEPGPEGRRGGGCDPRGILAPRSVAKAGHHPRQRRAYRDPTHLRIDTPIEVDYYRAGGILPFVLRQLLTE
jgi:aconitate hydratase